MRRFLTAQQHFEPPGQNELTVWTHCKTLMPRLPISLLILRKKLTVLQCRDKRAVYVCWVFTRTFKINVSKVLEIVMMKLQFNLH